MPSFQILIDLLGWGGTAHAGEKIQLTARCFCAPLRTGREEAERIGSRAAAVSTVVRNETIGAAASAGSCEDGTGGPSETPAEVIDHLRMEQAAGVPAATSAAAVMDTEEVGIGDDRGQSESAGQSAEEKARKSLLRRVQQQKATAELPLEGWLVIQ